MRIQAGKCVSLGSVLVPPFPAFRELLLLGSPPFIHHERVALYPPPKAETLMCCLWEKKRRVTILIIAQLCCVEISRVRRCMAFEPGSQSGVRRTLWRHCGPHNSSTSRVPPHSASLSHHRSSVINIFSALTATRGRRIVLRRPRFASDRAPQAPLAPPSRRRVGLAARVTRTSPLDCGSLPPGSRGGSQDLCFPLTRNHSSFFALEVFWENLSHSVDLLSESAFPVMHRYLRRKVDEGFLQFYF